MQIPIIGPSVKSYIQDANFQRCINLYPISVGDNGRTQAALIPSPGLKQIIDLNGQSIRGMITANNFVYVVVDNTVYKLTINVFTESATSVTIGVLSTTTGTVKMALNPTQLIIVDGVAGYIVTLSTDSFATIVDPDFPNSTFILYFKSYFLGNKPNTAQMQTSALNDGTSWDALDKAEAENKPDNIIGLAQSRGEVWVFGTNSIEVWDDVANPVAFPFLPRQSGALTQGCSAPYSIVEVNGIIVWLDDRKLIVQNGVSTYLKDQSSGFVAQIISDDALNTEMSLYQTVSDAIAFTFTERGHIFYQITFPTARKTWAYDFITKTWTERAFYSSYLGKNIEHLAQYGTSLGSTNIVGGIASGKIYMMAGKYFNDAGNDIHRIRTVGPIAMEGRWIEVDQLLLRMTSGNALSSGQGSNPQIMLRYSKDGGHTWSSELMRSIGKIGQYATPITWNSLGTAREWVFEFTFSDPIDFSFIEAVLEVTVENKKLDKES